MPDDVTCRWCRTPEPQPVLDLGRQPPADWFPPVDGDPADDPGQRLRMGVCGRCGLAQLLEDVDGAEEPRGIEPQALVEQAGEAVATIVAAGLAGAGTTVAEFDSPHGGSWRPLLVGSGCRDVTGAHGTADLVVDVFGLMHDADQRAALAQRVARVAEGGTLLLQFHSLESILRQRQWNALRHGHVAYYATTVVVGMLSELGFTAFRAWTFELYGGTVLLAAGRGERPVDASLTALLDQDRRIGVTAPPAFGPLAAAAAADAADLVDWLAAQRDAGRRVIGYGAASRAVPLLVHAGVDATVLPAIADGSPAKQGRRMPRSRIPIVAADVLATGDADLVLLFVPDLLDEVRRAYPQVSARGGEWAVSEPRPRIVAP